MSGYMVQALHWQFPERLINGGCAVDNEKHTGGQSARKAHGLAVSACLLYMIALCLWIPVVRVDISQGTTLTLWHGALIQWLRWPLILLGVALSGLTLLTSKRRGSQNDCSNRWTVILDCMDSACLLPWVGVVLLLVDLLPPDITSNAILYIPTAAVAWTFARGTSSWFQGAKPALSTREWTWPILIVSAVVYSGLGYFIAKTGGEHVGDEGHYLIQAESLYKDHDLDIKNNIQDGPNKIPGWANVYSYLHLSRNSRGDHWYSYHPFGISLLLAPIWPLGMPGRYILLALIAATGNVGMYWLSRAAGAGGNASMLAVAGLACSFFWATYAGRALPEMLGATLLSWLFWAMLVQERRQWLSAVLGAFCCSYLFVVQERFIPVSLMGFGFYGLSGLFSGEEWSRKLIRLTLFTMLCAVGWGLFIWSQFAMFEGGMKYAVKGGLMTYPLGMWGILADSRGLMSILPLSAWLLGAMLICVFRQRRRLFAIAVPSTILACVVTSCSVAAFRGGACVPGRYILVAVPLLVPCAALVLDRTNSVARWWFVFLSAASAALLVAAVPLFESMGRKFVLPISSLQITEPLFAGIYHPHVSFMHVVHASEFWMVTAYVISAILLTTAAIMIPARLKRFAVVPLLAVCIVGCTVHAMKPENAGPAGYSPVQLSEYLARIRRGVLRVEADVSEPVNLYDISKYEFKDFKYAQADVGVTTQDLGVPVKGRMISQPRVDRNDWKDRALRWATLTRPFPPIRGDQVLHIEGRMEGDAELLLAIKEGSKVRYEGSLPIKTGGEVKSDVVFRCSGFAGHLYILAHLTGGEGTFRLDEFYWSPFSDSILDSPAITISGNAILR